MAEDTFDLIVIGAGPGGYVAAIRAAQLGLKVACVEKEALGGTCLNVGCIPSKVLLESSELLRAARDDFKAHGIQVGEVAADVPGMMKRKARVVNMMTKGVGGLLRKNKVTHVEGSATLAGDGKVTVRGDDETTLEAERILIATGSQPVELGHMPFDGTHHISSTDALALEEIPERMVVIGAGAIGLELGSVWSRLGTEVVVVEMMDQVVPGADRESAEELKKALTKQGLEILLETKADASEVKDDKVHVTLTGAEERNEVCEKVLIAVGRRPNTEGLGVEHMGVELDDRGRIVVDEEYQTNVKGVYAIGDVIAGPMLAHKAEDEGAVAAELMAGVAGHVNYGAIPSVVYTEPELASVGKSEEVLKEEGVSYRKGTFPFRANGRAHALNHPVGFTKVLADEKTDRILGVHIVGPRASDLIAEAVLAMEFVGSSEDVARTTHAHPTLAEAFKEAALAVDGRARSTYSSPLLARSRRQS